MGGGAGGAGVADFVGGSDAGADAGAGAAVGADADADADAGVVGGGAVVVVAVAVVGADESRTPDDAHHQTYPAKSGDA